MEDTTRVIETLLRQLTDSLASDHGRVQSRAADPFSRWSKQRRLDYGLAFERVPSSEARFFLDWSSLAGTLPGHETLNPSILALIAHECNSWRTNDFCCARRAPIKLLLEIPARALQGRRAIWPASPLDLDLHLSGWAINLGRGGAGQSTCCRLVERRLLCAHRRREQAPRRLPTRHRPRPAAMMVTLAQTISNSWRLARSARSGFARHVPELAQPWRHAVGGGGGRGEEGRA